MIRCEIPIRLDAAAYVMELADETLRRRSEQEARIQEKTTLILVPLTQLLSLDQQRFVLLPAQRSKFKSPISTALRNWTQVNEEATSFTATLPLQLLTGQVEVEVIFSRPALYICSESLILMRSETCPGKEFPWLLQIRVSSYKILELNWPEHDQQLRVNRGMPYMYQLKDASMTLSLAKLPAWTFDFSHSLQQAGCTWDSVFVCPRQMREMDDCYFSPSCLGYGWIPLSLPGLHYMVVRISTTSFILVLCYTGQPLAAPVRRAVVSSSSTYSEACLNLRSGTMVLPPKALSTGHGFPLDAQHQAHLKLFLVPEYEETSTKVFFEHPLCPLRFLHQIPVMARDKQIGFMDLRVSPYREKLDGNSYRLVLCQVTEPFQMLHGCHVRMLLVNGKCLDVHWKDVSKPLTIPPERTSSNGFVASEILELFHRSTTWISLFAASTRGPKTKKDLTD